MSSADSLCNQNLDPDQGPEPECSEKVNFENKSAD